MELLFCDETLFLACISWRFPPENRKWGSHLPGGGFTRHPLIVDGVTGTATGYGTDDRGPCRVDGTCVYFCRSIRVHPDLRDVYMQLAQAYLHVELTYVHHGTFRYETCKYTHNF